jgi:hypothetical protein
MSETILNANTLNIKTKSFPLYEHLVSISTTVKPDMWKYVSNLALEEAEIVFVLIYHYYLLHTPNKTLVVANNTTNKSKQPVPYGGKVFDQGKGAVFQINEFPEELQKIISNYLSLIIDM